MAAGSPRFRNPAAWPCSAQDCLLWLGWCGANCANRPFSGMTATCPAWPGTPYFRFFLGKGWETTDLNGPNLPHPQNWVPHVPILGPGIPQKLGYPETQSP